MKGLDKKSRLSEGNMIVRRDLRDTTYIHWRLVSGNSALTKQKKGGVNIVNISVFIFLYQSISERFRELGEINKQYSQAKE